MLTPEQLQEMVLLGDAQKLVEAVADMTEPQRKELAGKARELYDRVTNKQTPVIPPGIPLINYDALITEYTANPLEVSPAIQPIFYDGPNRQEQWNKNLTAYLALFSLGNYSDIKYLSRSDYLVLEARDLLLKVLLDRRPEWSNRWVESHLKKEQYPLTWKILRALWKAGLCQRPQPEQFVKIMASELGSKREFNRKDFIPRSQQLLNDPELLETEVWLLFEVENDAFTIYQEDSPSSKDSYESWITALCKLSAMGKLDRQRLLDSCLNGLEAGFTNKYILSGYISLFDRLKPATDELVVRQERFSHLLSHPASHVISFAVKRLKELSRCGRLKDEEYLISLPSLMQFKTKTAALTNLDILARIARQKKELQPSATRLAVDGLRHVAQEVQEKALSMLEAEIDNLDEATLSLLEGLKDSVADTLRERLTLLLGINGPAAISSPLVTIADSGELERRWSALLPAVQNRVGLTCLNMLHSDEMPPPLHYDLMNIPVLDPEQRVEPIGTVEELIGAVSHAVETVDSAVEVERIMDGISRLWNNRPDGFSLRTDPLYHRITIPSTTTIWGIAGRFNSLRNLVLGWLRTANLAFLFTSRFDISEHPYIHYLNSRVDEITNRMTQNLTAPLLALPTHRQGWIDPIVLIERIKEYHRLNLAPSHYDFIQALLRLAPDHRPEALAAARQMDGPLVNIFRRALGDGGEPEGVNPKLTDLWVAAARACSPEADLSEWEVWTKKLVDEFNGPDYIHPAWIEWRATMRTPQNTFTRSSQEVPALIMSVRPEISNSASLSSKPLSALYKQQIERFGNTFYGFNHLQWLLEWFELGWMHRKDAFLRAGIHNIFDRLDMTSSTMHLNYVYLNPLFDSDRPLTEMAYLAMILGLAGRDADLLGHARDALLETIADGRCHPDSFSPVLIKLCAGGWVKLNRLAGSFAEVARMSPLHGYTIARILDQWLAAQSELPRDSHLLLELLTNSLARLGLALSGEARQKLQSLRASGKAARAATQLLQFHVRPTTDYHQALEQALISRLERGERWMKRLP